MPPAGFRLPPLRSLPRRTPARLGISLALVLSGVLLVPMVALSLGALDGAAAQLEGQLGAGLARARALDDLPGLLQGLEEAEQALLLLGDRPALQGCRNRVQDLFRVAAQDVSALAPLRPAIRRYDHALERIAQETAARSAPILAPSEVAAAFGDQGGELAALVEELVSRPDPDLRDALIRRLQEEGAEVTRLLTQRLRRAQPRLASEFQLLADSRQVLEDSGRTLAATLIRDLERRPAGLAGTLRRAQRDILTALGLTLAAMGALVLWAPRRLVAPLERMTAVVRRAAEGDYEVSAVRDSGDELGRLALQINRLLHRIRTFDSVKAERIREAEERFRIVAEAYPEGLVLASPRGELRFLNPAARQLLRLPAEAEAAPSSFRALPGGLALHLAVLQTCRGGVSLEERPFRLGEAAQARVLLVSGREVRGADGETRGLILMLRLAL